MRYHGNYCGPNWSAGRHQPSVLSDVPPTDDFDRTCKVHDAAYASGSEIGAADRRFVAENLATLNPKRWLAAIAVAGYSASRPLERLTTFHNPPSMNPKLRGAKASTAHTAQPTRSQAGRPQQAVTQVSAPAAIGSTIRGTTYRTKRKGSTSISLDVCVCLGKPSGAVQAVVPEMLALQYLTPVALGNDEVQNMTRVYQNYRITAATVHYRPFQGTSTGGEVILVSNEDPNYRPINTATNSSFYQRALATKHSVLSPIWMPASMSLAVDDRWKVCDNSNSTTIEEFSSGVLYFYADGTAFIPGFLMLDLSIEFEGLRFNSRNLISGSFLGLGTRIATNIPSTLLGADAVLTGAGFTTGDVYTVLLSSTSATFGAGLTTSNIFAIASGSGTVAYTLTGSSLLYARANSITTLTLFTTYDAALGNDNSDKLLFGFTSVGASTFPATLITQLRNSAQPSL